MTSIVEIAHMPTEVTREQLSPTGGGAVAVHESTLRAYNILERVKEYLTRGYPGTVTLDLIVEMETEPPTKES